MALAVEINTAIDNENRPVVVLQLGEQKSFLPADDAVDIGRALITAGMAGKITKNTLEDMKNG